MGGRLALGAGGAVHHLGDLIDTAYTINEANLTATLAVSAVVPPGGLKSVAPFVAAAAARVPIYVTENGIGTTDDVQRIEYVRRALRGVVRCLRDGIDVRGYFYWSVMDNFERLFGYGPQFGLVAGHRATQRRIPKPSADWLGAIARSKTFEE